MLADASNRILAQQDTLVVEEWSGVPHEMPIDKTVNHDLHYSLSYVEQDV